MTSRGAPRRSGRCRARSTWAASTRNRSSTSGASSASSTATCCGMRTESGVCRLGADLERLVHVGEAALGLVEGGPEDADEDAAEALQFERVLAVEEAWHQEPAEPAQPVLFCDLQDGRLELHRPAGGRLDLDLELRADSERAVYSVDEWVPAVVCGGGECAPDRVRACVDHDFLVER